MLLLQCSSTSTEQGQILNRAKSVELWPGPCHVNHPAPPVSLSALQQGAGEPQHSARAVQVSLTIPAPVADMHCSTCFSPAPCSICPADLNSEVPGTRTNPDAHLQTAQEGWNADELRCSPETTAVTGVQRVHLAPEQCLGCLWPVTLRDRMHHTEAWAATLLGTVSVPTCTFPLNLNSNLEMEHHEEKRGRGRDKQKNSSCWCLHLANENTRGPNKYRAFWQGET